MFVSRKSARSGACLAASSSKLRRRRGRLVAVSVVVLSETAVRVARVVGWRRRVAASGRWTPRRAPSFATRSSPRRRRCTRTPVLCCLRRPTRRTPRLSGGSVSLPARTAATSRRTSPWRSSGVSSAPSVAPPRRAVRLPRRTSGRPRAIPPSAAASARDPATPPRPAPPSSPSSPPTASSAVSPPSSSPPPSRTPSTRTRVVATSWTRAPRRATAASSISPRAPSTRRAAPRARFDAPRAADSSRATAPSGGTRRPNTVSTTPRLSTPSRTSAWRSPRTRGPRRLPKSTPKSTRTRPPSRRVSSIHPSVFERPKTPTISRADWRRRARAIAASWTRSSRLVKWRLCRTRDSRRLDAATSTRFAT